MLSASELSISSSKGVEKAKCCKMEDWSKCKGEGGAQLCDAGGRGSTANEMRAILAGL